jgi:heat shock protein HslJ
MQKNNEKRCMPQIRKLLLLLICTPQLLAGCGHLGTAELAHADEKESSICENQWLLESLSIDGREHRPHLLWKKMWRDRPYLTCDKLGYVRGSAGSNPYLGQFSLSANGELQWSKPPQVSRMGQPRDSSELEMDYLKALPQTDSARMENGVLILQDTSGATRLQFKRVAELPR